MDLADRGDRPFSISFHEAHHSMEVQARSGPGGVADGGVFTSKACMNCGATQVRSCMPPARLSLSLSLSLSISVRENRLTFFSFGRLVRFFGKLFSYCRRTCSSAVDATKRGSALCSAKRPTGPSISPCAGATTLRTPSRALSPSSPRG